MSDQILKTLADKHAKVVAADSIDSFLNWGPPDRKYIQELTDVLMNINENITTGQGDKRSFSNHTGDTRSRSTNPPHTPQTPPPQTPPPQTPPPQTPPPQTPPPQTPPPQTPPPQTPPSRMPPSRMPPPRMPPPPKKPRPQRDTYSFIYNTPPAPFPISARQFALAPEQARSLSHQSFIDIPGSTSRSSTPILSSTPSSTTRTPPSRQRTSRLPRNSLTFIDQNNWTAARYLSKQGSSSK
ncbi:MAG: hypothetical protein J3R72DRAFT_422144 [Linnemannia gamsii]|nr:MAG: hypothetical protein J3R72DRAFT_422144 [Linnemannia gamsii]